METSSLRLAARVFALPKAGHRADEYEDACRTSEGDRLPWCAAVADGATESAFARLWAQRLVDGFVAEEARADAFGGWLEACRKGWLGEVGEQTIGLPWYAAAKVEQGAFATFLGLHLNADASWEAVAVGDCGLFHLRGDDVLQAWPLADPAAFTNRPPLLCSLPGAAVPPPMHASGTFQAGDAFLLATDAVAAWLLRAGPAAARTWTADAFVRHVHQARHSGALRNDDVTLAVVSIDSARRSVHVV